VTRPEEVFNSLRSVFISVLNDPAINFDLDTRLGQTEGWDSFAQINLIIEIESTFGVEFDSDEFSELTSVEKILNSLSNKLDQVR